MYGDGEVPHVVQRDRVGRFDSHLPALTFRRPATNVDRIGPGPKLLLEGKRQLKPGARAVGRDECEVAAEVAGQSTGKGQSEPDAGFVTGRVGAPFKWGETASATPLRRH